MQIYQAEICIGGLLTNTVVKNDLTAAEIIILRRIHGDDAVKRIEALGDKKREYQFEYDRLLRKFGRKKVEDAFPGARPILPQTLKDMGIVVTETGHINNETVAKGPNNPGRKSKREKELDALAGLSDEETETADE